MHGSLDSGGGLVSFLNVSENLVLKKKTFCFFFPLTFYLSLSLFLLLFFFVGVLFIIYIFFLGVLFIIVNLIYGNRWEGTEALD